MQNKKVKVHSIIVCLVVSILALFSFNFVLSNNNSKVNAATANLSFTMDDQLNNIGAPFDWYINIKDQSGSIVYSKTFNGVVATGPSVGLTVGDRYSIMVYTPTGVTVYLTLTSNNKDIYIENNYLGNDFVMPSSGANIEILFAQNNNSIFFDSTTI